MLWERASRVGGQTPSGKLRSANEAEEDIADIIDLTLNNYVYPNSNTQYPFLIKNRLWVFNSYIYADMPMLAYWRVDDEYVGPDCMLLNPRNVFIQAGKSSTYDAEYVYVSTFVSKSWLESKKKLPGWSKAGIDRVLRAIKDGAKPAAKSDSNRQTAIDPSRNSDEQGSTSEIEIVTKYARGKKGHWVTFCPDYDNEILRDITNRLPSGKIPVIWKHTMPLITSSYGVGEVERGESLQKATDSFVNLAHDGAKYNVYPIHKYISGEVQRSTLRWEPGAFWGMENLNSVQTHSVGSQNLDSFIRIYQFLKSAQLNLFGSSDTMISQSDGNPSFGKTPQALQQQEQRQGTRDRWDRDMYETAYGELVELFVEMLIANNDVPIEFYVHNEDVNRARSMGLTGESEEELNKPKPAVRVKIPASKFKGQYRFIIDMGSSMVKDDLAEHQRATELLMLLLQIGPDNINQMLMAEKKRLNIGELIEKVIKTSSLKDAEQIIKELSEEELMQLQAPMDGGTAPPQGTPQGQPPAPNPYRQQMTEAMYQIQDPENRALAEQLAQMGGL
jgi:hypothetical protein